MFGALGATPMRWVWSERLEASRAALLQGEVRSVTDAAFAHGFSEVGHFSRASSEGLGFRPVTYCTGRGPTPLAPREAWSPRARR